MRQREWRLLMMLCALLLTCSVIWPVLRPSHFTYPPARELPPNVLEAVSKAVPGFELNSYRSELFSGEPAWLLIGRDSNGRFQRLDISDIGEVIMIEPD